MNEETEYILDTEVALWLLLGDERLAEKEFRERFLSNPESSPAFYQVSAWEIQIKYDLKRLLLPEPCEAFLMDATRRSGLAYRTIEDRGISFLGKLPQVHRDPSDRLLIAHAAADGQTIITANKTFL